MRENMQLFLLHGNNLCSVAIEQKVTEVNHEPPEVLLLLWQEVVSFICKRFLSNFQFA